MAIQNIDDLENIFNSVAERAIKKVGEKALSLLREYISIETYGTPHSTLNPEYANGTGTPTYQFLSAFILDQVQRKGNEVTQTLFYDNSNMISTPPSKGHWGIHSDIHGNSSIDDLPSYLNTNGFPGISPIERKPFWDDFLNSFDSQYMQWFIDAFKENGIDISGNGINVSYRI